MMSNGLEKTALDLAHQFQCLVQMAAEIPLEQDEDIQAKADWQETAVIRAPDGRFLRWEENSGNNGGEFKETDPTTLTKKQTRRAVGLENAQDKAKNEVFRVAQSLESYQDMNTLASYASPKAAVQISRIVNQTIGKIYSKLDKVSKFNEQLERQQDLANTPIFLRNPKQAWFKAEDLALGAYQKIGETYHVVSQPAVVRTIALTGAGTVLAVGAVVLRKKLRLIDGGMRGLAEKAGIQVLESLADTVGELGKDAPILGKFIKSKKARKQIDEILNALANIYRADVLTADHFEQLKALNDLAEKMFNRTLLRETDIASMKDAIAAVNRDVGLDPKKPRWKKPPEDEFPDEWGSLPKTPKGPKSPKPGSAPETKVPPLVAPKVSPPPGVSKKPTPDKFKPENLKVTKGKDNNWSQASIEEFLRQVSSSSAHKDQISDNLSDFAVAMFSEPEYMKRCEAITADANQLFKEITPEDLQDMKIMLQDPEMQIVLKEVFSDYGGMAALQSSAEASEFDKKVIRRSDGTFLRWVPTNPIGEIVQEALGIKGDTHHFKRVKKVRGDIAAASPEINEAIVTSKAQLNALRDQVRSYQDLLGSLEEAETNATDESDSLGDQIEDFVNQTISKIAEVEEFSADALKVIRLEKRQQARLNLVRSAQYFVGEAAGDPKIALADLTAPESTIQKAVNISVGIAGAALSYMVFKKFHGNSKAFKSLSANAKKGDGVQVSILEKLVRGLKKRVSKKAQTTVEQESQHVGEEEWNDVEEFLNGLIKTSRDRKAKKGRNLSASAKVFDFDPVVQAAAKHSLFASTLSDIAADTAIDLGSDSIPEEFDEIPNLFNLFAFQVTPELMDETAEVFADAKNADALRQFIHGIIASPSNIQAGEIQAAFDWGSSDHPRAKDGKFSKKSGAGTVPTGSKQNVNHEKTASLEAKYGSNSLLTHAAGRLDAMNETVKNSLKKAMFGAPAVNISRDVLQAIKAQSPVAGKIFKEKLAMVDSLKHKTFKEIASAQKTIVSSTSKFVNEDHPGLVASIALGAAVFAATSGSASILAVSAPLTFLVPEEIIASFDAVLGTVELTEEGIAYIRLEEFAFRGASLVKGLAQLKCAHALISIANALDEKKLKKSMKNGLQASAGEGISIIETKNAIEAGALALINKLQDYGPLTNPTTGDLAAFLNIPAEGLRSRNDLAPLVSEFRAKLIELIAAFLKIKNSADYAKTLKNTLGLQYECHKLSFQIITAYRH